MPYKDLTIKHLRNLETAIIKEINDKGLNSSGETASSFEIINGNELTANESFYYLVNGRGPGKFPPPPNIQAWVRQKLNLPDEEVNSVSFLIGRKISQRGTNIYNDKSLGVDLDSLINEMTEALTDELPEIAAKEALNVINKFSL